MSLNKSFNPRMDLPYPKQTDGHYRPTEEVEKDGINFDKDYPYIDKSKKFLRKRRLVRLLLLTMVFPFSYIRMGLKIRGKKNLRKNKKLLRKGALSISNHVNTWDYIAVMNAVKPFKPYLLVINKNITSDSGPLIRLVGGVPIPENDYQATIAYLKQITDLLNEGGWLHIYPEGSMWEYYRYIRPFKKGVAHLARISDKPIVPLGFSYREASWLRKKLFKQRVAFNLYIGEPIFINKNLPVEEQEIDLLNRCHHAVVTLSGLSEEENKYEAIFNNSQRIDFE